MSIIGSVTPGWAAAQPPSLPAACGAALRRVEWGALAPLLLFIVGFHGLVAGTLVNRGLPVGYLPRGEIMLLLVFSAGVIGCSLHVLAGQIVCDLVRQRRGLHVKPLPERAGDILAYTLCGIILAATFTVMMLANANLKPALFAINPQDYDMHLEIIERALVAGPLPTEWLIANSSPAALHAWDFVYGMFALFLLISVMIALHREGMRGGARLVLALSAGLLATLMVALAYPTKGPIYVHPDWFAKLAETDTAQRAADLALTVRQYLAKPDVRYAVAGISAMPSYHVLAWTCALLLVWRRLAWPLAVFGTVMVLLNWTSTVALGWHYALDGLAGIVLAAIVCWLATMLIPHRRPATPPECV